MVAPKAAVLALPIPLAACNAELSPAPSDARYDAWLVAGHRAEARAYADDLRRQGVGDVVPMDALSRTSRRWRLCRHDEFATRRPLSGRT